VSLSCSFNFYLFLTRRIREYVYISFDISFSNTPLGEMMVVIVRKGPNPSCWLCFFILDSRDADGLGFSFFIQHFFFKFSQKVQPTVFKSVDRRYLINCPFKATCSASRRLTLVFGGGGFDGVHDDGRECLFRKYWISAAY